jgi:putative iron-regulated protein
LVGCGSDSDAKTEGVVPSNTDDAVATYAEIVHASYADSLATAQQMDAAIQELLAEPTAALLASAREAWLAAREPYLETEVYRFYDGPIDNPDDGPEGMINAWPLDEAYIDYVEGDDSAGIINDTEVEITEEALMDLNEEGGEENIATGFHAIEFLLWGQDASATGPGDRPHTDYLPDATNAERRALYLETVSALLVEQLKGLVDAWAEGSDGNYRADFESAEPKEALRRILTGMIILSGFETGGERLQAALDSGSQEDEHSCFSDNTHRDMVQDIQGVLNVWQGRYAGVDGDSVDGTSIEDVLREVDPELSDELDERIKESLALANALEPPFDQEISPTNDAGNERVRALVTSLRDQEGSMQEAFVKFDLEIPEAE